MESIFIKETREIIRDCGALLDQIESDPQKNQDKFLQIAEIINRLIGAARAFDQEPMAKFSEILDSLGKSLSFSENLKYLDLGIAFFIDTIELMGYLVDKIEKPDAKTPAGFDQAIFRDRLNWLAAKMPVAIKRKDKLSQKDIDSLLNQLLQ